MGSKQTRLPHVSLSQLRHRAITFLARRHVPVVRTDPTAVVRSAALRRKPVSGSVLCQNGTLALFRIFLFVHPTPHPPRIIYPRSPQIGLQALGCLTDVGGSPCPGSAPCRFPDLRKRRAARSNAPSGAQSKPASERRGVVEGACGPPARTLRDRHSARGWR